MKIIVDSNIVFSAVLNTESKIGDLLFNSPDIFEFYSVLHMKTEIEKHKEKICHLTGFDIEKVDEILERIFREIEFFKEEIIPFEIWKRSARLVRDVDMNDIAFVALTEYLDANLWTGDKKLMKGLEAKGYTKCYTTDEMFDLRNEEQNK